VKRACCLIVRAGFHHDSPLLGGGFQLVEIHREFFAL
jgi:hypothetical protein